MTAADDRNATGWIGRPQVGRFYGDFLCMASIHGKQNFSWRVPPIAENAFQIKGLDVIRRGAQASQPFANIGGFRWKVAPDLRAGPARRCLRR